MERNKTMKRMIMNMKRALRRLAKVYVESMKLYGEALNYSRGLSAC